MPVQKDGGLVQSDVDKARTAIAKIQGFVVELPLHFLDKEDLTPNLTYILNFAPNSLFTWEHIGSISQLWEYICVYEELVEYLSRYIDTD